MQYSFVAAGAMLLATVVAQPHGHYNRHARRNAAAVTEVVDVYETVMLTATVWVDEQGNTISAPVTGTDASTVTGEPQTTVKPGEFNEPTSTQAPAPVVTPSSSTVEAAPSVPETTTIQVASVTPEAPVAPTTTSVAEVAPVTTTPVEVATTPAVVAAPATTTAATSSGGSSTGECSSGSPCSGDITFYEAGLGACGDTNNSDSDYVVALAHGFMGELSNTNPYCGKTVTIEYNGATVEATVVDKCMGCVGRDLDLSNIAFKKLGIAESVGRTTASWYFN